MLAGLALAPAATGPVAAATTFTVTDSVGNVRIRDVEETELDGFGRVARGLSNGEMFYSVAWDAEGRLAKVEFKDIIGYLAILFIVNFVVVSAAFMLMPYLLS